MSRASPKTEADAVLDALPGRMLRILIIGMLPATLIGVLLGWLLPSEWLFRWWPLPETPHRGYAHWPSDGGGLLLVEPGMVAGVRSYDGPPCCGRAILMLMRPGAAGSERQDFLCDEGGKELWDRLFDRGRPDEPLVVRVLMGPLPPGWDND